MTLFPKKLMILRSGGLELKPGNWGEMGATHVSFRQVLAPLDVNLTTGKFNASGVPCGKDQSQFRGKKQLQVPVSFLDTWFSCAWSFLRQSCPPFFKARASVSWVSISETSYYSWFNKTLSHLEFKMFVSSVFPKERGWACQRNRKLQQVWASFEEPPLSDRRFYILCGTY